MSMVQILTTCRACSGKALLPTKEEMVCAGRKYFRHVPCIACRGSGKEARWIHLHEFVQMLIATAAEPRVG